MKSVPKPLITYFIKNGELDLAVTLLFSVLGKFLVGKLPVGKFPVGKLTVGKTPNEKTPSVKIPSLENSLRLFKIDLL